MRWKAFQINQNNAKAVGLFCSVLVRYHSRSRSLGTNASIKWDNIFQIYTIPSQPQPQHSKAQHRVCGCNARDRKRIAPHRTTLLLFSVRKRFENYSRALQVEDFSQPKLLIAKLAPFKNVIARTQLNRFQFDSFFKYLQLRSNDL